MRCQGNAQEARAVAPKPAKSVGKCNAALDPTHRLADLLTVSGSYINRSAMNRSNSCRTITVKHHSTSCFNLVVAMGASHGIGH